MVGGGQTLTYQTLVTVRTLKTFITPYNLVRFYVGEITGTTPQTVSILTDSSSIPIQVSEGNKWYTYVLPKDKGLYKIFGDSVKKVVVKADITTYGTTAIIPSSTIEASFKGSNTSKVTKMSGMFLSGTSLTSLDVSSFNTSNVTDMRGMFGSCTSLTSLDVSSFNTSNVTSMYCMFQFCNGLTSLDLSNFDTSNVTDMDSVFNGCSELKTITMKKCTQETITKIQNQLTKDGITRVEIIQQK